MSYIIIHLYNRPGGGDQQLRFSAELIILLSYIIIILHVLCIVVNVVSEYSYNIILFTMRKIRAIRNYGDWRHAVNSATQWDIIL